MASPSGVPASIAIFWKDFQRASLKDARVIPLTNGVPLNLDSNSELWTTGMLGPDDQQLPSAASIRIEETTSGGRGHQLLFPDGTNHLRLFVNNKQLIDAEQMMSDGYRLEDGDLVLVYCTNWLADAEEECEWIGPLAMQYRVDPPPVPPNSGLTLDKLPREILQGIFAYLPVDEALYNIPAVCTTFLEVVREKTLLHQWEVANNAWMTSQEVDFCRRWMSQSSPVTSLVLKNVVVRCFEDQSSVCLFLDEYMAWAKSTVTSIEFHFKSPPPWEEEAEYNRVKKGTLETYCISIAQFPALKKLKLTGFPAWTLNRHGKHSTGSQEDGDDDGVNCFPSLERLWVQFNGKLAYDCDALIGPLIPTLKSIVFSFSGEQEKLKSNVLANVTMLFHYQYFGTYPVGQPCTIEELFGAYAPAAANAPQQRVLIFHGKATDWDKGRVLLEPLHRLHALSLTINGHLGTEQAKKWISAIPVTVKVLMFMTSENFTDELCEVVADQCPLLEVFACNAGSDLSQEGVTSLTAGCRKLSRLFLLKTGDNGIALPRTDILPEKFAGHVKEFDRQMRMMFG